MELRGRVYLCRYVYPALTRSGEERLYFPLIDRLQHGSSRVLGYWSGPEAHAFHRAHFDALKPGTALDIVVTDVHGTERGELVGRITHIELAPPRWPAAGSRQPEPAATTGETTE